MARIPMTSGFQLIPEGTYTFKITGATYNEDFGKIEINMETEKGQKYTERFKIKDNNDEYNDKALGAFSYFAKTALNDFDVEDVDVEELIGHFITAEVIHTELPSNKDPKKTVKFANLGDKEPSDGWETVGNLDLDSLLD